MPAYTDSSYLSTLAGITDTSLLKATSSSNSGWLTVGRTRSYTPTKLDVGHRLQLQVSVRTLL